jgi:hypothetical protein
MCSAAVQDHAVPIEKGTRGEAMNSSHWANEQARQRIADLRREAAGTELLRAARREHGDGGPAERNRVRSGLHVVRGTVVHVWASLAAITLWSGGFRRG